MGGEETGQENDMGEHRLTEQITEKEIIEGRLEVHVITPRKMTLRDA